MRPGASVVLLETASALNQGVSGDGPRRVACNRVTSRVASIWSQERPEPRRIVHWTIGMGRALVRQLGSCPASAELRNQLARSWQVDPDVLFQREPLTWAALGESPQFDVEEDTRNAERTRIQIFQKMWKLRCSYKAQRTPASEALTPGVEAR